MPDQFSFKKHPVSDAERLWLQEAAQPGFQPKQSKARLHARLPRHFRPEQIDLRLYVNGRLTPVGLWHIDPIHPLLVAVDSTISTVKSRILEETALHTLSAEEISAESGLGVEAVGAALFRMKDLGHFFTTAHSGAGVSDGIELIQLTDDTVYDDYLNYDGIDDLLERFYRRRGEALEISLGAFAAIQKQSGMHMDTSDRKVEYRPDAADAVLGAIERGWSRDGRAHLGNVPPEAEQILLASASGSMTTHEASQEIRKAIAGLSQEGRIDAAVERHKDWRILKRDSEVAQTQQPPASTANAEVQEPVPTPWGLLLEAIRQVNAVKYALGVGGIVAVIAIISFLKVDFRVAVLGTPILFAFMTVLVVFVRVASLNKAKLSAPALALVWFAVGCFMVVIGALITSIFFDRPLPLSNWIVGTPAPKPIVTEPIKDRFRLTIKNITFGYKGGPPYISASMSIGRLGEGTILVTDVFLTVDAASRTTGAILNQRFELLQNRVLAKDAIEPIEFSTNVGQWVQMMHPVSEIPSFQTHFISFFLNVQATDPTTGNKIWLDLEMPQPAAMNCDHQCVGVNSLDIPAGSSPYKKCTIVPNGSSWKPDCAVTESP